MRSIMMRRLTRHRLGLIGLLILLAVVVTAAGGSVLAPRDPFQQALSLRLLPPLASPSQGRPAFLGTDQLGRDVLSRIIFGSRTSLIVATLSVALAGVVGLALGLAAGFYGGILDSAIMRLVDMQLAFPLILLALAILGLMGASLVNLVVVFVITGWPLYARTIRGAVLAIKGMEFMEAARALGVSDARLMVRHLLPNVGGPLVIIASYEMARIIILEAALGFLGLGVQPPTPTWGNMLADGREYIRDAWWLATFPGVAIMVTAAGINFVGDWLRDLLDPRLSIE
ncbi:MAG: ABC transporter permease [Armatimonadetes bacterium]|nr:ABC transporter permease [Armatimonadota bacterium]